MKEWQVNRMSKLYSPYQISNMSNAEVRKAYSELRSIANKRLGRLQAQNLGKSAREGYRFPTIAEINSSSKFNVASQLADVSQFLRSERTTVRGEKKFLSEFVESMESKGYGDLVQTTEDIYKAIEFMEEMREQYSDKIFDSGDALDVLQQAERLKIPADKLKKNFDFFATHLDQMEKLKPSTGGKEFSQRRINNLIKKWS